MKRYLIFCLAFLLPLAAGAQDTTMTMKRAKLLVPRPALEPVKSLIPGQQAPAVDTLETSDPRVLMVLRSDNTWQYVKNADSLATEAVFQEAWSTSVVNPYQVKYDDLPLRITLWLVDSASQYTCPYQTKVFSKFGMRRGRQHQGVDLPYPKGTPVRAAFDGRVRYAARASGYGNLVVIRHANGLETFYGHLSELGVQAGDWVHNGDVIGLGGSTGRASGPHLHFETRYKGYAFDPQWIIDFESGDLRQGAYVLRRRLLNPSATYVPKTEDEEEEIYLTEEQERAEEERLAKERAAARYHTIRSGDTLSGIALKYGTSVSAICKLNNITPTTTLRIGRSIRVK